MSQSKSKGNSPPKEQKAPKSKDQKVPKPMDQKASALKARKNPDLPYPLESFEIETGLNREEMNTWLNEVIDYVAREAEEPLNYAIVTKPGRRSSFMVSIAQQQIILIMRRWLKQDFFTISHWLSNWNEFNTPGIPIYVDAYEIGAVYLFVLTNRPYIHPEVSKLASWLPWEGVEFPNHEGSALLCPEREIVKTVPYEEIKKHMSGYKMSHSAARYTGAVLKERKRYTYDGFRTWFYLKAGSGAERLYTKLGDSFPIPATLVDSTFMPNTPTPKVEAKLYGAKPRIAEQIYNYINSHRPKRFAGKDDEFYDFAAKRMNDIIHTNSWPEFKEEHEKKFGKNIDPADECWTAFLSLPTVDFALRHLSLG